ncbi:glycosyltransferase family 4 protein [Desulfovibrio mangrovi]|uniref:glycosyltransferase family 4 protein n=1 Tax=Desulfovibrio mangrovi TaxID=2976983 RepID=UPI002247B831|nr:glycosyltransferase family 4 protein [Desulfovibrio mangrovi]UZP67614.1 glycosyltransferase family 4 protein [Desulfovibrio mangrovi]
MKIAFLLYNLAMGGSERKVVKLCNHFNKKYKVSLIVVGDDLGLKSELEPGVDCISLKDMYFFWIWGLIDCIAIRKDIDIIFCMNPKLSFYSSLISTFLKSSLRIISCINTSRIYKKRHSLLTKYVYSHFINKTNIVFGAKVQQEEWKAYYNVRSRDSHVVYNGVDSEYFSKKGSYAESGRIRITTVGRLSPEKGHINVLKALTRESCRHVTYSVVGSGPCLNELKAFAEENSLAVVFYGSLDDVRPILEQTDVFILPSIAVETFSNAVLEAMAYALPCVITDIGGAREMISNGDTGIIIPPGSVSEIENAISRLSTSQERARLGKNAQQFVRDYLSDRIMFRNYQALVEEL